MTGLPEPLTEQAQTIDQVWNVFLIGAAAVGGLIIVLLAITVVRDRRRSDRLPEQVHYRIGLEVAYTAIPLVAIIGLLILTLTSLNSVNAHVDDPDLVVDVEASQWQWQFHYPEGDVTVAKATDTDTDVPQLTLPRGQTVEFQLTSPDVIHSFWVPGFLYKRDVIPGEVQIMQVTVTGEPGVYRAACAEFCGLGHTNMRFTVRVVEPDEFASWLSTSGEQQ